MTTPNLRGAILADVVFLNRAVYGGDDDLLPQFRPGRDPARDPSDAGIRPALNLYDRYDKALALQGLTTLGAAELGFGTTASSTSDDLLPGDGNGIDRNYFYAGDLYRNHVVRTPSQPDSVYPEAAAVGLAAVRTEGADRTLHLVFRGTDADLGKDGEAGTAPGQVRYYGQLQPLIDAAYAFAGNVANGIDRVVVSGHSLGGAMADLFALYDGARFTALTGVELEIVALASAGVDPGVLALRPGFDPTLVSAGAGGTSLVTPAWYSSYDHAEDIVRNPERYDFTRHLAADPEQAPVTRAATGTLLEHLNFEGGRLQVELPLLDQYAVGARLETNFLPQHYASLYEMVGDAMAHSLDVASEMGIDRIVALGGRNARLEGTVGSNNVNAFGLPENNRWMAPADGRDVWVLGLSGNDSIIGGHGRDLLDGGTGYDRLDGRDGADALLGHWGNDALIGGAGADMLRGGAGNDTLSAGSETDTLYGDAGWDKLSGGSGNDVLAGGAGNDTLIGGADPDQLRGGAGNDAFQFVSATEGGDAIADFRNATGDNDLFAISAAGFGGGLTAGAALAASRFQTRSDNLAQDSDDRFVFRTTDKTLWFDSNGNGAGGLIVIADLNRGATVTTADIFLV